NVGDRHLLAAGIIYAAVIKCNSTGGMIASGIVVATEQLCLHPKCNEADRDPSFVGISEKQTSGRATELIGVPPSGRGLRKTTNLFDLSYRLLERGGGHHYEQRNAGKDEHQFQVPGYQQAGYSQGDGHQSSRA